MERNLIILFLLVVLSPRQATAQSNDFGMFYELGVEKKLSPKWNVSAEADLRTRNNTRSLERWSVGLSAEYKFNKRLKASAGYIALFYNNIEEMEWKKDGFTPNKWAPSYWGVRHRFNASVTGNLDLGRFNISLRERYQFTFRPIATGKKYDFDEEEWKDIKAKSKHVLRSRLQLTYDIPHWKVDPFVNVEFFNGWALQKIRYQAGVEYKLKKAHTFSFTYRFQNNFADNKLESNIHLIGLGYKYKF